MALTAIFQSRSVRKKCPRSSRAIWTGSPERMPAMAEPQAKMLVVDDEVKKVKRTEALQVSRGHTVIKAYNGEEALQQAQGQRPDLVLLDVMMPHIEADADDFLTNHRLR